MTWPAALGLSRGRVLVAPRCVSVAAGRAPVSPRCVSVAAGGFAQPVAVAQQNGRLPNGSGKAADGEPPSPPRHRHEGGAP